MFDPVYKIVSFFGTPLCTDKATYAEWHEAARRSPPGEAGFCTDCTPEYQARMIEEGKCENPWIKFELYDEDDLNPHKFLEEENIIFKLSDKGIVGYIPTDVKKLTRARLGRRKL